MKTVVVPPVYLVRMFGVPESVTLPVRVGDVVTFSAHGCQWRCKRLRRSVYVLSDVLPHDHARFGRAAEIAEDIGHVLETGALPMCKGPRCF